MKKTILDLMIENDIEKMKNKIKEQEEEENCPFIQTYDELLEDNRKITNTLQKCMYDKIVLEEEKEKLETELKETEGTLEHRDSLLSIMYDLIRNTDISDEKKLEIIRIVIDEECGEDLDLKETVIHEMFRQGLFR